MNCLLVNGGPNKPYLWSGQPTTSYTRKLADEVMAGLGESGDVGFREIQLMDVNLPYCTGCMACFYKGEDKCPHAALVQPILQAMRDADLVILTSPVYALNVSALLKGFFDHAAYNYHRPSFFGKKGLVISSTAGGMAKANCRYMRDVLMHWGFDTVYSVPVIRMGASELSDRARKTCRTVARRIRRDVASGAVRGPSFKRVFFYQLWRNVCRGGAPDSADLQYWRQSGLIERVFAPGIRVGPLRRAFGALVNGMLHLIIK